MIKQVISVNTCEQLLKESRAECAALQNEIVDLLDTIYAMDQELEIYRLARSNDLDRARRERAKS